MEFDDIIIDTDEIIFEEDIKIETNKNVIHGDARKGKASKLYHVWSSMIDRCHNPNNPHYKDYGGRGIIVVNIWRYSYPTFKKFVEEKLGPKPTPSHTLDRIINNGNYDPSNLKWSSRKEQAWNRRGSVEIVYKDRAQCLTEWCKELGLDYDTTKARIRRYKWSIVDAFEAPKMHNVTITFEGRTQTVREWSIELNINYDKLRKRLQNGWTVERAFGKLEVK